MGLYSTARLLVIIAHVSLLKVHNGVPNPRDLGELARNILVQSVGCVHLEDAHVGGVTPFRHFQAWTLGDFPVVLRSHTMSSKTHKSRVNELCQSHPELGKPQYSTEEANGGFKCTLTCGLHR